jgi:hypothetical protein
MNNDGGGLSVTCCINNFALKFYNQCSAASNLSQIGIKRMFFFF